MWKKLDATGHIALRKASASDPKYRGAIGGVPKDEDSDRLINNGMRENSREARVNRWTRLLGAGPAFVTPCLLMTTVLFCIPMI